MLKESSNTSRAAQLAAKINLSVFNTKSKDTEPRTQAATPPQRSILAPWLAAPTMGATPPTADAASASPQQTSTSSSCPIA